MEPIELMAKMTYLSINMDMIKQDPKYWESLPQEKQTELHRLKKELDDYFKQDFT